MKSTKNFRTIMVTILMILAGLNISAFKVTQAEVVDNRLKIGTGLPSAVYSQMTKTLIQLRPDLIVETGKTSGGIDNMMMLLRREADVGIMQADVIEFMRRTDPMITKKVRSLVGLHTNYLHAFVLRGGLQVKKNFFQSETVKITDIRQLTGKSVAAFSSAPVTLRLLNERLGLRLRIIEVGSKDEGLEKLRKGEVWAFFATGGKYVSWMEKLDGNVYTLANMRQEDIQRMQAPYFPGKVTYRNLGVVGVNVLAVRNEMVCWNFTGPRSAQLLDLQQYIRDHLNDIQEMQGSNPAWQEIEPQTLDDVSWQMYTGR